MEQELTLVRIGRSARLERLLPQALAGIRVKELSPEQIASAAGRRLLFAAALDEYGEPVAQVRVRPDFKLNSASATRWIENDFAQPS